MKIDTTTLSPWAEIHRMLANMRTLTVTVGGDTHTGEADLSADDSGNVMLAFAGKPAKKRR
jgi:hypothetical protein